MAAVIGTELETSAPVTLSIEERLAGLYILGKPRTGKSWLLVNLIRQDIEHGRGVFFIDPHGDAIDDLFSRYPTLVEFPKVLLIDPEEERHTIGVNPLRCKELSSLQERSIAFKRTKGIFDKLWKKTFEERPWLQLILQNTIYAFIENQGYTIADLPLFFSDPSFRYYLSRNIEHNTHVLDFWLTHFPEKSIHDQAEIISAAQTRLEIMLAHPYVRHVLGQSTKVIDFSDVIEKRKVVLVRFSSGLSDEVKKIIGTAYLTELLDAVERRTGRDQFSIFVDEFQEFAGFEDFATLITRAPKLAVATTLAHHERRAQLLDDPRVLGATAIIPNKVFFQNTPRDAAEFAPEFAREPEREVRFEQELVLSRYPVYDLLRGHTNPDISAFADRQLRPLKERLEDIIGEEEAERSLRTEYLDDSALWRLASQTEGTHKSYSDTEEMRVYLSHAGLTMNKARKRQRAIQYLIDEAQSLRLTIRELNSFFYKVMEGLRPGVDEYCDELSRYIRGLWGLTSMQKEGLMLFLYMAYGWPFNERVIPYRVAKYYGLYPEECLEREQAVKAIKDARAKQYYQSLDCKAAIRWSLKSPTVRHFKRFSLKT